MARPLVQVLLDDVSLTPDVRGACELIDADIDVAQLDAAPSLGTAPSAARSIAPDARIVLTASVHAARANLPGLRDLFERDCCATLVLSPHERLPSHSLEPPIAGEAISFSGSISREDLASRLAAMCELRRPIESLKAEVRRLRHRDEMLTARMLQLDEELRVAAELQRDVLPHDLPEIRGGALHRLFRPAGAVSGDIYDVVRVDEEHVAICLADATGHDLAAALLTAFIKRSLSGSSTCAGAGLTLDPAVVLADLNAHICQMGLAECQFVAAIHAVFNEATGTLKWARGGAPYPILARAGRTPRQVESVGSVLGADPGAVFETLELTLTPGDSFLMHTDGLDALLAGHHGRLGTMDLTQSAWFADLGSRRPSDSLHDIERRLSGIDAMQLDLDDITAVAIELFDVGQPRPGITTASNDALLCAVSP